MTKEQYQILEAYMYSCMQDSAHDREHIYRVLNQALRIAETEQGVDYDVLIAACLLHDIGRQEQFADPALCHAQVGSEKAYAFLLAQGYGEDFAQKVRHCILTHRFRKALPPESLEAKILFDADKLDVTGAIGIARSLMYKAEVEEPLYVKKADGSICDGSGDEAAPSFFREYKFKLEKLYDKFFTAQGAYLAQQRRQAAADFYHQLYREVQDGYAAGQELLQQQLERK